MTETEIQKTNWRGRIYAYAPLILWTAVIFINSSTIGASQNTSRIIRPLLEWLFPAALPATLDIYHGYIRKLAHFTEYGVLGFLAARAFWVSHRNVLRKFWFVGAFGLVVLIAAADEYNQSFNSLRTSSGYDVLIDVSGGLFAVAAFYIFKTRRQNRPKL
jgi:VanZ family protein